jgi:hypothetical protein
LFFIVGDAKVDLVIWGERELGVVGTIQLFLQFEKPNTPIGDSKGEIACTCRTVRRRRGRKANDRHVPAEAATQLETAMWVIHV